MKAGSGGESVWQVLSALAFTGRGEWVDLVAPCTSIQNQKKRFSYRWDIAYFICVYCSVLFLFCFWFFCFFLNFIRLGSFLL